MNTSGYGHRSVSQVTTFAACGEQYRLEKVAKAPRSPAAWFLQGTAFHTGAEFWERTGRTVTAADVQAVYEAAWAEEDRKAREQEPDVSKWLTGGRTRGDVDYKNRHERGWTQLAAYMEWAQAHSEEWRVLDLGDGHPAVEVSFAVTLGGIEVIGSIDQVIEYRDGRLLSRDLKTGSKLPAWPFQLAVYDVAIATHLGIDRPGWGDYYMAKNTAPTMPYELLRYSPETIGDWFRQMDEGEKAGVYLPNPGDSCRTCGVSDFCLAMGGRSAEYAPLKEEQHYQVG